MSTDSSNSQAAAPHQRLEWEPLSPVKRKRLQVCFDHAQKLAAASDNYDFDYANDMLSQCVTHDPGNFVYVDAFLENLYRKYKNNRRGGGGGPSRSPFKKAAAKKEWAEVLKLAPPLLSANPWDVATLRPLAEACAAYGFFEVELRYLKSALDANSKDIEVNKHCALTLERVGQFDQAIACWRRIGEIRKSEPDVDRKISQLTLDKTRALSGLGDDEKATGRMVKSFPGGPNDSDAPAQPAAPAPAAPQPKRDMKLTPRQKLERAISDDETNIENYLMLSDLYLAEGRPTEAVNLLSTALSIAPGDLKVQEKYEVAEIEQMRVQVSVAEKRAAHDGTDEAKQLAKDMRQQFYRRELEIATGRANRKPKDLGLQLELAVCLKRAGNLAEAEKMLSQLRMYPELKPAATLELGECLQQQRKYSHALQFYTRAIELTDKGDVTLRKLALYRAGVLAIGLRQLDPARRWLRELVNLDPEYRDAKARLDKIRGVRNKE